MKSYIVLLNELKEKEIYLKTMPACCYIESIKGCPYSCAMCTVRFTKPQKISSELLKKISPYFKYLEVLGIHGDGEPLLGDVAYFVEEAVKNDVVLHMNSTGFFLTREIADLLLKAKLSIRFSIHAGKPETYAKIMGNDFNKVLDNIAYLVKKDNENNKASDLWFSFIVMKENIDEIGEFLKVAHKTGIKHVRFMELVPNIDSVKGFKMPERDLKFNYFEQNDPAVGKMFLEKLPQYKLIAGELGIKIEVGSMEFASRKPYLVRKLFNKATEKLFGTSFFPIVRRKGACVAPWIGQLVVEQSGNVKLCCSCNYSVGDLNESTLEEIWNGEKMRHIRGSFKSGVFPKSCGYCRGIGFGEYPRNSAFGPMK
ncbi:MAG: radical SAM protein [Candidatus Omnitrophica bacterium]|nr:radical SAM protein [Candidatus Omnitrophota bacterium]